MKPLPSQAELQSLLNLDPLNGTLSWKPRPRSAFQSEWSFKMWNVRYANKPAFITVNDKGYLVGRLNGVNYRASRVIYKLVHGIDPDFVDHENGNTDENSVSNLRNVTNQQNLMNMKQYRNNSSGCTGVHWDKKANRWVSKICFKGKRITIGSFVDLSDAINARKQAEITYGFHPNHGR